MNKFLIVALTTVGLVAPTFASANPINPFSGGDYGTITLRDGSVEAAALPAVDFDNYNEVIGKLNIVHVMLGEVSGGGVDIIVNQCGGVDAVLATPQPFIFFGQQSWVTFCTH